MPPTVGKTHSRLITAFSLYLVKDGPLPKALGRLLKRAEETRLVADYRGDAIAPDDARDMVEQAELFVAALRAECLRIGLAQPVSKVER